MPLTPMEIHNKEFSKSFRGYNEDEVDQFLDKIVEEFEKLYKENLELKDKILVLNDQIDKYNSLEHTLKETLIVAQSTADEVIAAAKEKAKTIVENANIEAKRLIDEANEEVYRIKKAYENLLREMYLFKTRYKSFIEAQLTALDEFYSDIENSTNKIDDKDDNSVYIEKKKETVLNSEDFTNEEIKEDMDQLGA